MRRLVGAILAGGGSTRFGGAPKGLARVGSMRIVDRVAAAMRDVVDDIILVANDPDAASWLPGVRVVRDVMERCGALGGLHASCVHARAHTIVVAWDMPFVTTPLLHALRDACVDDVDAVLPSSAHGSEPLCACYAPSCIAAAERLLAQGERRARALGESVRCVALDASAFGDPAVLLMSVNTAADLAMAESLSRSARAPV